MSKSDFHCSEQVQFERKLALQLSKEREEVLKAQAEGIVEFETKLAEITIPNSERRNEEELYNKMNISQFQELAGFMNWYWATR